MIKKTPKRTGSLYTFFALEAQKDNKSKVKHITISSEDGEETVDDYGGEDIEETQEEETVDNYDSDDTEAEEDDETQEEETVDSYDDSEEVEEEPDENQEETVGDYEGGEQENTEDDSGEEETTDDTQEETVGDYEGGEGDYQEGDEASEETTEQPQEESNTTNDSLQKYNLYTDYMMLYNNIKKYIDILDNSVKDDINANQVIMVASEKLKKIISILNEYMVIKFTNVEYYEALAFFQTAIASVKMVIELLRNNSIYLKH